MQPTDPPQRTGKPVEDVNLSGAFIPWDADDQPCYVAMVSGDPDHPLIAIPAFHSLSELAAAVRQFDLQPDHVKTITNGAEFLQSVPRDIEVVMNPRIEPERGTVVYTLVLRD